MESLEDYNKKAFYWYLFNTEINKIVLRKVYNTNHKLINDPDLKCKLEEFYEVEELIPRFKQATGLNDLEYVDFKEKTFQNLI